MTKPRRDSDRAASLTSQVVMEELRHHGKAIVKVLAAILGLCMLLAILLPSVGSTQASLRSFCSHNLKQIALAMHNYHDYFREFPRGSYPAPVDQSRLASAHREQLSWRVTLLPYLERRTLFDEIREFYQNGPQSNSGDWRDWKAADLPEWRCLPDNQIPPGSTESRRSGRASYHVNVGSRAFGLVAMPGSPALEQESAWSNGAISMTHGRAFEDFVDGMSQTYLVGERRMGRPASWTDGANVALGIGSVPGTFEGRIPSSDDGEEAYIRILLRRTTPDGRRLLPGLPVAQGDQMPGARWHDGQPHFSALTTHLPPNQVSGQQWYPAAVGYGIFTLGSHHLRGAQVAAADASVHFIAESIDPELHRSLGTRNGGEQAATP